MTHQVIGKQKLSTQWLFLQQVGHNKAQDEGKAGVVWTDATQEEGEVSHGSNCKFLVATRQSERKQVKLIFMIDFMYQPNALKIFSFQHVINININELGHLPFFYTKSYQSRVHCALTAHLSLDLPISGARQPHVARGYCFRHRIGFLPIKHWTQPGAILGVQQPSPMARVSPILRAACQTPHHFPIKGFRVEPLAKVLIFLEQFFFFQVICCYQY